MIKYAADFDGRPVGEFRADAGSATRCISSDQRLAWYFNVHKHPETTVEVRDGAGDIAIHRVRARVPEGTGNEKLFAAFAAAHPHVADP